MKKIIFATGNQDKMKEIREIPPRVRLSTVVKDTSSNFNWLRGPDLNRRPSGYEPDELPGCSTPRPWMRTILG